MAMDINIVDSSLAVESSAAIFIVFYFRLLKASCFIAGVAITYCNSTHRPSALNNCLNFHCFFKGVDISTHRSFAGTHRFVAGTHYC